MMETMTHESWGHCFCGEYHGEMVSEVYVLNPVVLSRADVALGPDGLAAEGYDHYIPSIGLRLERDSPADGWYMTQRYERKVAAPAPEPGEEFVDAEEVNRLPVDSVIADADGFVFQVQEPVVGQYGRALAGIEGMGYATAHTGLVYPVTLLRHGGGGAVNPKES